MQTHNYPYYQQQAEGKKEPAHFFFALFENDSPRLFVVTFTREDDSLDFTPNVTEVLIPEGKSRTGWISNLNENIRHFLEANPNFTKENTAIDTIDTLIGLEIVRNGNSVGPPVDLLKITNDGPTWLRRKPGCFEI